MGWNGVVLRKSLRGQNSWRVTILLAGGSLTRFDFCGFGLLSEFLCPKNSAGGPESIWESMTLWDNFFVSVSKILLIDLIKR